jgi:hypothetical protein
MNLFSKSLLLSTLVIATGCGKIESRIVDTSQKAAEAIGCEQSFKSKVYDSMYDYLDNEKAAPQLSEFTTAMNDRIDEIVIARHIDDEENVQKLKDSIAELYKTLIERAAELKQTTTSKEHLQTIIEMEMEDQSTPENIKLNQQSAKQFATINTVAKDLELECEQNDPTNPTSGTTTPEEEPPVVSNPPDDGGGTESPPSISQKNVLTGSHNVLATAYQSCQVLEIPEISAATADVQGIERYGTHEDGIGGKRRIASLSSVQNTHPYIKVSGGAQAGCFNVHSNPLIYDYGGQAAISNNTIDFSKNSGTGTEVLGIDCSAYVSAAIAAGGLRYKPGLENKAVYIRQNSSKFINAKNSGFTCFNNVTATPSSSIAEGDIVAVNGHVLIIDKVGADPFGITRLKSATDCNSMSTTYFDFVVSQSSPSKGGIGLNKYKVKDYLRESTKMTTAFLGIAKAYCQAYFGQRSVATPSTEYGILRHNGTAECLSPRIQMAYQSCVSQCLQ